MKHHEPLSTAKALASLLILGIAFVLFHKFITNQDYFMQDTEALRNYVIFSIAGMGFLVGLLYLVGQTSHKASKTKTVKSPSKSKKKKK